MPAITLNNSWPMPSTVRPIVIIGAGGIVADAHLPAYQKASFPVAGIFDVNQDRARALAAKFDVPKVFASLDEAMRSENVVFDIAVPAEFEHEIVAALPAGSAALLQKPMGVDLDDARRIRQMCRDKKLTSAVNFQLRFSPMMLAVRDAIQKKLLGEIVDVDIRLNLRTPWELFPTLKNLKRVEILVHSVHYLDWIRGLLGEPFGVYARTVPHPSHPQLKSTRTSAILDYGDAIRCCLSLNHCYEFGPEHEAATVSIQGTDGALRVSLGLLLNYPVGRPETVHIATREQSWSQVPIQGRWFPDGFVGRMANLQRYLNQEDSELVSDTEDAYRTMALVEACYASNASGGTKIPQ